ncbi:uncharacterized protein LOC143253528 isoform X2 [Tachypleus tridentatus]|uniref:uncharacterized protein LOC143253528 isoform X2 n=1 Tax=Tachypleus tridentatus TaxID=6853 RepID=UPI003FD2BD55
MGRHHDLLKHVKHNDIDKVQKLLTCNNKRHHHTTVKGDNETLQKKQDMLLDIQKKESVSHVDINCHEPNTGSTPLILATLNGSQDLCLLLLHFEANVNATDSKGNTALHIAAFSGKSELLELLIENGAEVDGVNNDKNTPTHIACQNCTDGNKFVLLKLLKAAPDVLLRNKEGQTPFDLAAQYNRIDAVALLLDYEPSFRKANRAFVDACIRGHKDTVQLMLDYGMDPSHVDPYVGTSGLHESCRYLRYDVTSLLIQYDGDTVRLNNNLETPKSILASYPANRTDHFLKFFDEWKDKPKLKPKYLDIISANEKGLYPLLKTQQEWTLCHPSYCSVWSSAYPHTNLLDDNSSSMWITPSTHSSWVVFDLGRPFTLSGIGIFGWNSEQMPRRCLLQKAEKLEGPWFNIKMLHCSRTGPTDPTSPGILQEFHGFLDSAQFWRLFIKDNYGASFTSLHGVQFYGVDSSLLEFLEDLNLDCIAPSLARKGITTQEELRNLTKSVVKELVSDSRDQLKLWNAIHPDDSSLQMEHDALDAVFSKLKSMLMD